MTDKTDETHEVERLREHNRQLLAELKAARAEAKAAVDASEAARSAANDWRDRWYQIAVAKPLEDELRGAAAGPWKYLRDVASEQKLLTMEADAEGIERPVWRDEKGEPADLTRGLYAFLRSVYERTGNEDLGKTLRASDAMGSGTPPNMGRPTMAPAKPERKPETVQPAFGLR